MDENDSTPAAWNPLATLPDEWRDLEVSGGRARVLFRRWSGRERLAYDDALTSRMLTTADDGVEVVKLGTLRLFGATLTIHGSEGFPEREDGREFLTGTRDQVEADLLSITDEATLVEILRHAREVQPLPGQDAPAASPETAAEDDDEDPSPASSTGQGPTSDADPA